MNTQILELVIYKIKPDQIRHFQAIQLKQFRDLIQNMEGLLSYETYSAMSEDGLFVDQVEWEDLACAERAAAKIKILENEEPFASIFGAFEEIKICNHFKKVA